MKKFLYIVLSAVIRGVRWGAGPAWRQIQESVPSAISPHDDDLPAAANWGAFPKRNCAIFEILA